MHADYNNAPVQQTPFSEAERLFKDAVTTLSTGDLMQAPHDEVERYAVDQGRRIVRALLQDHMRLRGQARALTAVVGADTEERTHVRQDAKRRLITTVGEVTVPRPAYGGRGLAALHPTDAALNLPANSYSFELQRKVAITSAEVPFEQTVKLLAEYTGLRLGLRQVEEIARQAARDMAPFYEAECRNVTSVAPKHLLVLSFDQKGVVMRREDLRQQTRVKAESAEPKLESRLAPGEKPNRKRMATVAAVYAVAPHFRKAEAIVAGLRHLHPVGDEDRPRPPRPVAKRVWASVQDELHAVVEQGFAEALRRDPARSRRWFVVIDGDKKLEMAVRREAKHRGIEVTLVLDFIHVLEYLWRAGQAFFDESSRDLENWVLERLTLILKGHVCNVAAGMRRSATKRGLSPQQRKPVDRAAKYMLKRKAMMRYDELLALGTPIASGVIEGTCRSLVNDRLDVTGARWSVAGAEAVLRLRAISRSGDWEEYWTFHTQAEHKRNHAAYFAEGKVPAVAISRVRPHLRLVK